ncbi:MAG: hypothetical protein R6X25_12750 [Candidatus Krumholzibacteriia bacterium]
MESGSRQPPRRTEGPIPGPDFDPGYTEPVHQTTVVQTGRSGSRASWGAIFAGTIVALAVMMTLNLLGLGVGLLSINPAQEDDPLAGLGTGAVIWWVATWLLALIVGGLIAGRLSGPVRRLGGALHGVVAWGLVSIIVFWGLSTGIGAVVSTTVQTTRQVLELAGRGASTAVSGSSGLVEELDLEIGSTLRQEAREVLREAGIPENVIEVEMAEVENALRSLLRIAVDDQRELDRQTIVDVLARETTLTRAESQQLARRWEQEFGNAEQTISRIGQRIGRQARQTAGAATDAVGTAAIIAFAVLLLGGFAAAIGGWAGTRREPDVVVT